MAHRESTAALVVAAGVGDRAGGSEPKQFRKLAGRPVIAYCVQALQQAGIDHIQLVIGEGQDALCREALGPLQLPPFVIGGATRQQSVRNGLAALEPCAGIDTVLIHDAARPFLPADVVTRLLVALDGADGAVPVLPVVDTLARGDAFLGENLPREEIVRVQTPQAFPLALIAAAHRQWRGDEAGDDAQVARAAGARIATVRGDRMLEKLTYAEDFANAEARLGARFQARTGLGFDVHAFGPGDSLQLGGVTIEHDRGLVGHSDADVVLHALTDAVLGAIAMGDIGDHFPPSDPAWRGAASSQFLAFARDLVEQAGGRLLHVDVTIICESPRIGPHREAMRATIATLLQLPPGSVSVKATTTERLGFTGRGEGIAAQAVATVSLPETI